MGQIRKTSRRFSVSGCIVKTPFSFVSASTSRTRLISCSSILVPRGRAPFGQHRKSRPLARSNTGSPRFTDFPSLCACSELSLTNVIGSGLNLLCLQSHSKPECRWTGPEVVIFGADQKERGLWGREWCSSIPDQAASISTIMDSDEGIVLSSFVYLKPFWTEIPWRQAGQVLLN